MNNHVTVLKIDGQALDHNLNYLKSKIKPKTKILAVVKADAYGSDGLLIAEHLKDKVDYFGVAYAHEGVALREAGIQTRILVLHPQANNWLQIVEYCLEPSIYSFKTLKGFAGFCYGMDLQQYPVHVNFNTGLNRLGFTKKDILSVCSKFEENNTLKIESIFSHLAASEDKNEKLFTLNQIQEFKDIIKKIESHIPYQPFYHMTNTSGIINYPEAHFNMVRTGIGLYGFGNHPKETDVLKNTHNLYTIISQIHQIEKGESVSYNRAFIAEKSTKIATLPIGHADGIFRSLGNQRAYVSIRGKKAPIIGNVCMDMLMVDITHIPCEEGDQVIIFDNQKSIEDIASAANTISYEVLTAISQRVKREFLK